MLRAEDAARVQQRLIDTGFLSGAVDGAWGPRMRNALRAFRIANGLGADDEWDEQTQRELFAAPAARASAAVAPNTREHTETALPRSERNPLNRPDAIWIQTRLRELGYFSANATGVWGPASRNALRDFKSMNGLQEDSRWDKETEQRLSSDQGIRAASTFIGDWAEDSGQCRQERDRGAPIAINSRGAKAAGVECDFRSVKRETAGRWRIAATCSADGDSWSASIGLRLSGPSLTWSSERGTTTYVRCSKP